MGHEFSCFQRTVKWPRTFYFVTFNWTSTYSLVLLQKKLKNGNIKRKIQLLMTIEIYLSFYQILIELLKTIKDDHQFNFQISKGEKIIYFIINTQDTNLYI